MSSSPSKSPAFAFGKDPDYMEDPATRMVEDEAAEKGSASGEVLEDVIWLADLRRALELIRWSLAESGHASMIIEDDAAEKGSASGEVLEDEAAEKGSASGELVLEDVIWLADLRRALELIRWSLAESGHASMIIEDEAAEKGSASGEVLEEKAAEKGSASGEVLEDEAAEPTIDLELEVTGKTSKPLNPAAIPFQPAATLYQSSNDSDSFLDTEVSPEETSSTVSTPSSSSPLPQRVQYLEKVLAGFRDYHPTDLLPENVNLALSNTRKNKSPRISVDLEILLVKAMIYNIKVGQSTSSIDWNAWWIDSNRTLHEKYSSLAQHFVTLANSFYF